MRKVILSLTTALLVSSCAASPIFAQSVTHGHKGKHPYDIALSYCQDKGGLAQYTVSGSVVKFSCQNDLSNIVTISTD